jgi:hypothetical protein
MLSIWDAPPVGMSSRLRKAYVAASFFDVDLTARARHSVATAASSSAFSRWFALSSINLDEQAPATPDSNS